MKRPGAAAELIATQSKPNRRKVTNPHNLFTRNCIYSTISVTVLKMFTFKCEPTFSLSEEILRYLNGNFTAGILIKITDSSQTL